MVLKNLKKYFYLILFLSFLFNFFTINNVNKKFNNYVFQDNNIVEHKILKGDSLKYWSIASKLENNFFSFPYEYRNAQLYPKIIFLYNKFLGQKFFDKDGNAILDKRLNIFYFQLIIYFLSLTLLFKILKKNISVNYIPELIVLALSIDPFINQVHHAIYSESIFCSLLIIFISFFLSLNFNSKRNCFFLGIIIGFLFFQRSAAIYYVVFLIPIFLFYYKDNWFKISTSVIFGYLSILFIISLISFNTFGKFIVVPSQGTDAFYGYLAPNIFAKQNDITKSEARRIFYYDKEKELIKKNNLDIENFEDRLTLLKYKKQYANEVILNDLFITTKVLVYNYSKNLLIHYNWVTEFFNSPGKRNQETIHRVVREKNSFLKRSIYSLVFILITFIGFIYSFKVLDKKTIFFLFFSIIYFFAVSGWIGNPRYFLVSYLFSEFFFAIGIFFILQTIKKKINF